MAEIAVNRLLSIWAKSEPFHPLLYHMIDAGNVASALLSTKTFSPMLGKFSDATGCPIDKCKAWLAYLVALHDIGKCDPDFQAMGGEELIKPLREAGLKFRTIEVQKFRHAIRSYYFTKNHLQKIYGWGNIPRVTVAYCHLGHHSDFNTESLDDFDDQWNNWRDLLAERLKDVFNPGSWSPDEFKDYSTAGTLLLGLIVLSDWIASNTDLMPVRHDLLDYEYAGNSMMQAIKAVDKVGFSDQVDWNDLATFDRVWNGFVPRPVQKTCEIIALESTMPGLFIIEAPMGDGKTEAAIYLATRYMASLSLNGLYIALPTAATSNQMHGRLAGLLEKQGYGEKVRLVHGMAWLIDDRATNTVIKEPDMSDDGTAIDWFRPMKRGLLAPYAVGTIDQALMSVLNVRFGFLRLFGLSGKVLIIDEVHAYDAYMNSILTMLLRWCSALGIPVIMLSATLPGTKKAALISAYSGQAPLANDGENKPYPLITTADRHGCIKEVPVKGEVPHSRISLSLHYGMLENAMATAELAVALSKGGGCICILANTVGSAQGIYRELKKLLKDDDVWLKLFHARFRAGKRQEIEKEVLSRFDKSSLRDDGSSDMTLRPRRAILVATQVVEQSLDLDFDEMITEVAPIDLLLQRAGRLHRHNRKNRQTGNERKLHVLLPSNDTLEFGKSEYVYDRYILIRTLFALQRECINLPEDMRKLIELVYSDKELPDVSGLQWISNEDIEVAYNNKVNKENKEAGESSKYLIRQPDHEVFSFRAMTRPCAFNENEGEANSYFFANTRYNEYEDRQVILLDGDRYTIEFESKLSPTRDSLADIMKNFVSLPAYRIDSLRPFESYEEIKPAPRWLAGKLILRLKNRQWIGIDQKGNRIMIKDDEEQGIIIEKEDENGNV